MRRKEREVTDKDFIESVIASADVCRIGFAVSNMPYIVTMNFGFENGEKQSFWFHCATEGRKLEMIGKNNFVCFELDTDHRIYKGKNGCDWGMNFKSIIGYGRIFIAGNDAERKKGLDLIMRHYGGTGEFVYDEKVFSRTLILRLDVIEMTAKEA